MKNSKGTFGYLKTQKKKEVGRTILFFGISLLIFVMGYLSTGSNNNLLTIVAVLGCLPASKCAVEMVMYFKGKGCSEEAYLKIKNSAGSLPALYDLFLTSYQKNYQISSLVMKGGSVCAYTEDAGCDVNAAEKHITDILCQNGYKNLTVKIFSDLGKYLDRMEQMNLSGAEENKFTQEILQVICDISL